jgi:uncharacterized protein (TIGR02996 family)
MTTPPELLGLLRDAKANPDDIAPRLILADWLEEHGQPERAELIRLQCRETLDQPRVDALLSAHQVAWFGVLWAKGVQPLVHRGLFRVAGPAKKLLSKRFASQKNAPELDWVEALSLEEIEDDQVPRLLHAPHAQCLNELQLWIPGDRMDPLPPADWERAIGPWSILEGLPTLSSLHLFSVGGVLLGAEGLRALLAGSPRNLRTLELHAANLGDGAMHHLAASPPLPHLERLDLSWNHIRDAGLAALASWPGLARVWELDLRDNCFGNSGLRALAQSPHRAGLRELDLSSNSHVDFSSLASGPPFPALEGLVLGNRWMDPRVMEALASSNLFPVLSDLEVPQSDLGDEGVRHLLAAPWIGSIRRLQIEGCNITDVGARLILESPHLGNLQHLNLHGNDAITRPVLDALRDRFPTVWFF